MSLLTVDGLDVSFGALRAVRDASFTLDAGECLAVVGESGSGKSVTARTLVGLTGPRSQVTARALSFAGRELTAQSESQWRSLRGRRIGLVLQDALVSLDPLRTVGAEVAEPLRVHRTVPRSGTAARVLELLDDVGVPEPERRAAQYPHQLSGGLRQRALIASGIAAGPDLLIADEPTTALDVSVQAQILDLLDRLRRQGTALLLISHDLTVVARLADRVAVMYGGRIVETGPTERVLEHPRHPYTRALLDAVPATHARGTRLSAPAVARPAPLPTADEGCPYAHRCASADARCRASLPAPDPQGTICWHPDATAAPTAPVPATPVPATPVPAATVPAATVPATPAAPAAPTAPVPATPVPAATVPATPATPAAPVPAATVPATPAAPPLSTVVPTIPPAPAAPAAPPLPADASPPPSPSPAAEPTCPRPHPHPPEAGPLPDPAAVQQTVLAADRISKRFRAPDGSHYHAVREVSLTLRAGETLGVVGESGSGKTTVARILLGLLEPDSGQVTFAGRPWSGLPERQRRASRPRIQAVQQDPLGSFDPRYGVERLIGEALARVGLPRGERRSRTIELLDRVGLPSGLLGRRPLELSGGQRQRVAIARALAPAPDVIVCDEPVSALDVSVQAQILDLLADLQRDLGVALLFISHDLGVVHHVSDRIAVMKDGRVVETGPVDQVFADPAHAYTRELLAAVPRPRPVARTTNG
jgi:peptide/nickel transport system ATP-binding protein